MDFVVLQHLLLAADVVVSTFPQQLAHACTITTAALV